MRHRVVDHYRSRSVLIVPVLCIDLISISILPVIGLKGYDIIYVN